MRKREARLRIRSAKVDYDEIEAEQEKIEYSCVGTLCEDGDLIELSYEEPEDTGMEDSVTTLFFKKSQRSILNIRRTGDLPTGLIFDSEKRRQICGYEYGGVPLEFCIDTRSISNTVTYDGGKVELDYLVEFAGELTQHNKLGIEVRPAPAGEGGAL
ncbi:MAG: DUF1934 domain-containing protein [Clostridia bacterium]|nr:DUF1934 domain-containing protein [Clostridia bacterium]